MGPEITDYNDLEIGKVYNKIHIAGKDEVYSAKNGKSTVRVVKKSPLVVRTLFSSSESTWGAELLGGCITYAKPSIAFREYQIFEAPDKSEWFIKAARVYSILESIDLGYLTPEMVENKKFSRSLFVVSPANEVYFKFYIDGIASNPYLEKVVVYWSSWQDARADLKKYNSKIVNY